MKNQLRYSLLMLITAMVFTGCGDSDDRRHPLYIKALKDQQTGDGSAAAEKLNELLKRRPRSIHTHKLLAAIYDEMLHDPAKAVHHYQAYLQAMPEAADAEEVSAWCLQAEKRHYTALHQRFGKENIMPATAAAAVEDSTANEISNENNSENNSEKTPVPGNKPDTPAVQSAENQNEVIAARDKEIAELKEKLERYKTRYHAIRREVDKLRKERSAQTIATPQRPARTTPDTAAPAATKGFSRYKVVSGDTPGSIARKVYGKSSLHYVIMRANPQVDARKLRPGMVLNIPPRQENLKQGN